MPVYEYKCEECEHQFERLVFTSSGFDYCPCPECGKKAPKVISGSQLRFYGSGWTKPNVNKRGEGIGTQRQEDQGDL